MPKLKALTYQDGTHAGYDFACPGCGRSHFVYDRSVSDRAPSWIISGTAEAPTFEPSVLVQSEWYVCHSFVRNGKIQYLPDCTHRLSGQTVEMPDIEGWDEG